MTSKPNPFKRNLVVASVPMAMLAVLLLFSGCKKEQPAAPPQAKQHASRTPADQSVVETVALEQKTCPIMEGNPINKDIFVEYQGKKVYFCCKGCEEKFLANPEQYIAKLPQFQK